MDQQPSEQSEPSTGIGPNEVIERLYKGFAEGDADAMESCYHPDVHFSDPVFPDLNGPDVMKMWRTLLGRSDDLEITLGGHKAIPGTGADPDSSSAHWTAVYTFSSTGRPVTNEVDASFRFEDGLIIDHLDEFNFWRWSRQALGVPGLLLGWTPLLKRKVQKQSALLLESAG
jgi:ketosteroid isomerase-like protein